MCSTSGGTIGNGPQRGGGAFTCNPLDTRRSLQTLHYNVYVNEVESVDCALDLDLAIIFAIMPGAVLYLSIGTEAR